MILLYQLSIENKKREAWKQEKNTDKPDNVADGIQSIITP